MTVDGLDVDISSFRALRVLWSGVHAVEDGELERQTGVTSPVLGRFSYHAKHYWILRVFQGTQRSLQRKNPIIFRNRFLEVGTMTMAWLIRTLSPRNALLSKHLALRNILRCGKQKCCQIDGGLDEEEVPIIRHALPHHE